MNSDNKYQDFLIKLQNADESERDWLVMEFSLQNLSETLRQAVWAAAIPHWFDRDFLNAILANPLKDSDFEMLKELSFVEVFPERGFNIHERSRKLLLDKLWTTNKARYQRLSKRAAAYCKKQDQSVTAWRVETLYHGLLANNTRAKDDFINQGFDWYNSFQSDKLENLTQIVLDAVTSGFVIGEVAAYAAYYQAKLDILYSRYSSAQDFLHQALQQKTNKLLMANCIFTLGEVHYHSTNYKQARDFYQRALTHYRKIKGYSYDEANCIKSLGDVHLSLAEYQEAWNCYQQSLPIYQSFKNYRLGEANCKLSLGAVHSDLAEYEQAQDFYSQALLICKQIKDLLGEANCIRCLGRLQGVQSETKLAVAALQRASQLYEKFGTKHGKAFCFNDVAIVYLQQKQFTDALAAFNQAIAIFPDADCYLNRAGLYMKIDDYEKAEADIKQAETIGKNPAYTLLQKAALALWQREPTQAVTLCQQALAQRPADGNFRAMLALTLLADGQAPAADTEMKQALTAIYQQHDIDSLLDDLDKLARIYGQSPEIEAVREQVLTKEKPSLTQNTTNAT
jgi:tetratricopeptide (TPR) repeat protein